MRTVATASLALLVLISVACGGGSKTATPSTNVLSGNWQLSLYQEYPPPRGSVSLSGFLTQASNALTGSIETPSEGSSVSCGGVSALSGTITGQNVAFSLNEGGTTLSFTGSISSDNQSMAGDYQAAGGSCFAPSTTGTWNAFLIPPLNGNFTGTIDSAYLGIFQTGTSSTSVPVTVSGSISQSSNAGASNASLTGTINAVGYPCFATAFLTGTISGQSVYMDVYDFSGNQIGTLGVPSASPGTPGTPATVMSTSSGVSLVGGSDPSGLQLGNGAVDPCPPLAAQSNPGDTASVQFNFK